MICSIKLMPLIDTENSLIGVLTIKTGKTTLVGSSLIAGCHAETGMFFNLHDDPGPSRFILVLGLHRSK